MVSINGIRKFSGTYNGVNEFMAVLAFIPLHYDSFAVIVDNMISDRDQVFTQLAAKTVGIEAEFGHRHKLEAEK